MANVYQIKYDVSPTAMQFHLGRFTDVFRLIMGPIASGKTSTCSVEIVELCNQIPVDAEGYKCMQTLFVRNTQSQLLETTKKTFKEWFGPKAFAEFYYERNSPPYSMGLKIPPEYNMFTNFKYGFDIGIRLMPLDRPEDSDNLLSLNITNAFINEAREVPWEIVEMIQSRCGRFPSGVDFTKLPPGVSGVIADTNPPDTDSWIYEKFEKQKPKGWKMYRQPPAMVNTGDAKDPVWVRNEGQFENFGPAENIQNIGKRWKYYEDMVESNSTEFCTVMVQGEYGTIKAGTPVYPEYNDSVHFSNKPVYIDRMLPVCFAWDFGRTPAMLIMQMMSNGQLVCIKEFVSENSSVFDFAEYQVKPQLINDYNLYRLSWFGTGDPSGMQRGEQRDETNFNILREVGLEYEPCPTNLFKPRREAVAGFLRKMVSGRPGLIVGPDCPMLRQGFIGKYQYPKNNYSSMRLEPLKNEYSHIHDAAQYGAYSYANGLYLSSGGTMQRKERPSIGSEKLRRHSLDAL